MKLQGVESGRPTGPSGHATVARLRVAHRLTVAVIVLAAAAAAVGLFVPSVYRETAWVIPQNRGQDLVTLLALAVLAPVLVSARRGSPRGTLVWLGLLGYLAYTYTGAAFAYGFNALFLVVARPALGPWLAGFVLVKAATMGLALLSMTAFSVRAGLPVDATLAAAWVTLALAALSFSWWFFRHCGTRAGAAV